jgi:hypothetical protein
MEQFIERYGRVADNLLAIVRSSTSKQKDTIISLNKQQLERGEKPDGTKYEPYTKAYAKRKNKPLSPKTLRDTGQYYAGFDISFQRDYFEMFSRDKKDRFLGEIYKPFGLQSQNLEKVATPVKDEIVKQVVAGLTI